jgi:hypothetical protein
MEKDNMKRRKEHKTGKKHQFMVPMTEANV